jgi:hypothetical protein
MNRNSPFFVTQVECPVCGNINEFENIEAGAYTETERDSDFCPKGIIWANPEYHKINPLMYFMATCPNCFYTHEFNQSFREWKKNHFFVAHHLDSIRKQHQRELKHAGSVINRLGKALDPEGHPFESAVIKLLLGIHDETIIGEFNPWDVGRHYLRVAWLYREKREEREAAKRKADEPDLTNLERTLKRLRSHFDNQEDEIRNIWMAVETCFRHPESVAQEDRQREQLKSQVTKGLNRIKEDILSLRESLGELAEICAESKKLSIAPEPENIGLTAQSGENSVSGETLLPERNHLTLGSFLVSIKEIWTEVPLNELEAIKCALKYCKRSYREITDVGQESQKIQAAYLIAELSRRAEDYREAKDFFAEAERIGQDFIQKNQYDANKIALAQKIVELAKRQRELNLVKAESQV